MHPVCCLFQSIMLSGMFPRLSSRCSILAKSHESCSVDFEEQGDKVRVFVRTWDSNIFRWVCVATLDHYSSDHQQEISALGRIVDALGPDVSVDPVSGGSNILVEAFCEYLFRGRRQKLIDYISFDLCLFKRCSQRTASSVFGRLGGLAMTEFIINQLKGAEKRDWMSSHPTLRKSISTNDLGMPHIVDIVANIIGVWPLIVTYLNETGRKYDGDSLVLKSSSFNHESAFLYLGLLCLWCLKEGNWRVLLPGWNGTDEVPSAASSSWNLYVFSNVLLLRFHGQVVVAEKFTRCFLGTQ